MIQFIAVNSTAHLKTIILAEGISGNALEAEHT